MVIFITYEVLIEDLWYTKDILQTISYDIENDFHKVPCIHYLTFLALFVRYTLKFYEMHDTYV